MPVCVLCEGESFDCIDGLYYCLTCGTQSQDIRDEQVADDVEVDGRLQVAQQRKRGRAKQFFADKGKPWFMYEAFQFIIKAQVEYLISLGVDPALKDVVFKLWYKYLQVTGTAFTGSLEGTVPTKASSFYSRDAELLDINKRKKSGRKIRVDDDDEDDEDDDDEGDDELELCSHFSDEEFNEDDYPLNVPSKDSNDADDVNLGDNWTALSDKNRKPIEDIRASDDSSDSNEDEFVGSLTLGHSKRTKVESGHVTLQSTLAFCYLGLLWINEPVFVSDLVRWAKQGQLPYFQATRHIPHHMKFGSNDCNCLCPLSVPPVSKILTLASQISRILRLPRFPEPAEWCTYTARFIIDLHLPGFLHGVVRKLTENVKINMKIHPTSNNQSYIPNFEAGAMAFIVVALKLYYGIDDRTEREQEKLATPTESGPTRTSHDTIPLFTDWLKSWKHCEAKKFENGVPWTDEQFKLVRDPTAYSAFCRSDIFGSWEPADRVYTGNQHKNLRANRITNEESQEKYAQLFKSLMTREREEQFNDTATPKVTSFPATCAHVIDTDNGPAPCFDRTRSRGIQTEKIFGDPYREDNDLRYIKYSPNCADQNSFHSSYETLLTILADRIEMKPMDLQTKVNKLENALFFRQSLHGVL